MGNKYDATYDELYAIELLKGSFLSDVDEFIKSESPDWISGDGGIGIEVTRAQNSYEGKVWSAWNNNVGKEISKINRAEKIVLAKHASYEDGKLSVCGVYEDAEITLKTLKEKILNKIEKLNKNFRECESNRLFVFLGSAVSCGEIWEIIMSIQEEQRKRDKYFDKIYILNNEDFYRYDMDFYNETFCHLIISDEERKNIKIKALEMRNAKKWKNGDIYK